MTSFSKLYIDRPRFLPDSMKAHLVAGLIVAIATALRLPLNQWVAGMPFFAGMPFVVLFPAVIVATFLCGSTAGFLASLLSVVSAWLFIIPPGNPQLALYQTALFAVGAVTVVAVIAVMRAAAADVRRSNETLRVSEEKFRGLLESAPDAMIIVDDKHRIALINARAEDLFGYRREELLGQAIEMLIPAQNRGSYLAQLAAFMINPWVAPVGRMIDLHGVRKDGTAFPIEVSLGPLRTEAGVLVSNGIRDITARRQIEARLAETSKAKSDFLAGLSHELRTPLNAIMVFSEMIRDAADGPLDPAYRAYGRDIHESGRHLQNIINDILDISKIEGGRLELRDELVSIGEIAEACRRIVAAMAEIAGVSLSIDVPGSLPLIRSDRICLQQILLNLLSNAVKFTPTGGRVSLSAAIAAEGAVITVEDTGIGMRPEDIPIALQPFRQIDGALSRRFDGTGLGLPLTKALVELHGGRLEIQSAPAAGTMVRVLLPLERMAEAAA